MVEYLVDGEYELHDASQPVPKHIHAAASDAMFIEFAHQTGGIDVATAELVDALDREMMSRGTYDEYLQKMSQKNGNAVAKYNRHHFEYRTPTMKREPDLARAVTEKLSRISADRILKTLDSYIAPHWDRQPLIIAPGPVVDILLSRGVPPGELFPTTTSLRHDRAVRRLREERLRPPQGTLPPHWDASSEDVVDDSSDVEPLILRVQNRPVILYGHEAGEIAASQVYTVNLQVLYGDSAAFTSLRSRLLEVNDFPVSYAVATTLDTRLVPGNVSDPKRVFQGFTLVDGLITEIYHSDLPASRVPQTPPTGVDDISNWRRLEGRRVNGVWMPPGELLHSAAPPPPASMSEWLRWDLLRQVYDETSSVEHTGGCKVFVEAALAPEVIRLSGLPDHAVHLVDLDDPLDIFPPNVIVIGSVAGDYVQRMRSVEPEYSTPPAHFRVRFADQYAAARLMRDAFDVVTLSLGQPEGARPVAIFETITQINGRTIPVWWSLLKRDLTGGGRWGKNAKQEGAAKKRDWRRRKPKLASDETAPPKARNPASTAAAISGPVDDCLEQLCDDASEADTAITVIRPAKNQFALAVQRVVDAEAEARMEIEALLVRAWEIGWSEKLSDGTERWNPPIAPALLLCESTYRVYERFLLMCTSHNPKKDKNIAPLEAHDLIAMGHTARRHYPNNAFSDKLIISAYEHHVKSVLDVHAGIDRANSSLTCGLNAPQGTHSHLLEDLANDGKTSRNQVGRVLGVLKNRKADMVAGVVKKKGIAAVTLGPIAVASSAAAVAVVAAPVVAVGVKIAGAAWLVTSAAAAYRIYRASKGRPPEGTPDLPIPTFDHFGRERAQIIPIHWENDAIHLGVATDKSTLDSKHIVYDRKIVCRSKRQRGALIVGGIFAYPQVAASCLCNAHNALYKRHGAKQQVAINSMMDNVGLPGFERLRAAIAHAYPSKLVDADFGWLRHIGFEVKNTKWPLGKALNIIRSMYRNRNMPGVVKAFIKREVGKASITGELLTKARLIQGYCNDATAELWAREFVAFQKALAEVASVDRPFELYPGISFTMGSGLTAQDLSRWAMRPARWHLESDATNFDSSVNRDLFDAKCHYLAACNEELAEFSRSGYTVNGYVTYENETLKYRLHGTIKSGNNDTTSGNSLINALVTCQAMHVAGMQGTVVVAGDDMLAKIDTDYSHAAFDTYLDAVKSYGLVPKAGAFTTIDESSFISGAFTTVLGTTYFTPQLGRQLAKLWSTTRDVLPKHIPAYKRGVVKGFGQLVHVPGFREFLNKDYGTDKFIRVNDEHKVSHDLVIPKNDPAWIDAYCRRYDISPPEFRDLCEFLAAIPPLGAYACSHPVATIIVKRDCGDACDRVGNLRMEPHATTTPAPPPQPSSAPPPPTSAAGDPLTTAVSAQVARIERLVAAAIVPDLRYSDGATDPHPRYTEVQQLRIAAREMVVEMEQGRKSIVEMERHERRLIGLRITANAATVEERRSVSCEERDERASLRQWFVANLPDQQQPKPPPLSVIQLRHTDGTSTLDDPPPVVEAPPFAAIPVAPWPLVGRARTRADTLRQRIVSHGVLPPELNERDSQQLWQEHRVFGNVLMRRHEQIVAVRRVALLESQRIIEQHTDDWLRYVLTLQAHMDHVRSSDSRATRAAALHLFAQWLNRPP